MCQKGSCLQSMLCLFQPPALELKHKSPFKWSGKIRKKQKISRKVSWTDTGSESQLQPDHRVTLEGFKDLNNAERLGKFHLWESQFVFCDWQVDSEPGKSEMQDFGGDIFCCAEQNTISV